MFFHVAQRVIQRIKELPTHGWPTLKSNNDGGFDECYGTDTGGIVWLTNPWSEHFRGGARYEGSTPELCRWAIENSEINPEEYCFVDIGCGKGRPLIIASEYGFDRLIGVDYSRRLCSVAKHNIAKCHIRNALIACADATQFAYPTRNTFAFFYHPFADLELLNAVLLKLRESTRACQLVVAYLGTARDTLNTYSWLQQYRQQQTLTLFRKLDESALCPGANSYK